MSLALLKNALTGPSAPDSLPLHSGSVEGEGDIDSASDSSTLLEATQSVSPKRPGVNARLISDAIIGLSDGLTVPFALTAGLSALGNTRVVVFGGLAELTAGAISMGLGGYLGARSEEQSYRATARETRKEVATSPEMVSDAIESIFAPYEIPSSTVHLLSMDLQKSPQLADFLLHFQSCLQEPPASRAITCALTIALGYLVGGLLPLLPFFFVTSISGALYVSIGVMVVALFSFGYCKTCLVNGWRGWHNIREGLSGGVQMVMVGGVAAGSAMGLVKLFDSLADL